MAFQESASGQRVVKRAGVGARGLLCLSRLRGAVAVAIIVGGALTWGAGAVRGIAVEEAPPRTGQQEVHRPRVVVIKSKRRLYLFDGEALVRSYRIALGPRAMGQKIMQGDGRTPEGLFRICSKNKDSRYHCFLGISYPGRVAADRGLRAGLISYGEAVGIFEADEANRCPSWMTALGGGIGIHGHGTQSDWTAGCIALEDEDVAELSDVLRLGDEVEILP